MKLIRPLSSCHLLGYKKDMLFLCFGDTEKGYKIRINGYYLEIPKQEALELKIS